MAIAKYSYSKTWSLVNQTIELALPRVNQYLSAYFSETKFQHRELTAAYIRLKVVHSPQAPYEVGSQHRLFEPARRNS